MHVFLFILKYMLLHQVKNKVSLKIANMFSKRLASYLDRVYSQDSYHSKDKKNKQIVFESDIFF